VLNIHGDQYGIYTGNVMISGGKMSIHGNECGICAYDDVTQNGGTVEVTSENCAIQGASYGDTVNIQNGQMILESPRLADLITIEVPGPSTTGKISVKVNDKLYPYGGSPDSLDLSAMTKDAYYEYISSYGDCGYAIYDSDGVFTLHNAKRIMSITGSSSDPLTVRLERKNSLGDYSSEPITIDCSLKLTGDGSLTNDGTL